MQRENQVRTTALAFAAATLLSTRVPGGGWAPWIAGLLALATLVLPAWAARQGRAEAGRLPVVLLLLLMSVPPSRTAFLGAVPEWAIALVILPALHIYLGRPPGAREEVDRSLPIGQVLAIVLLGFTVLAGPRVLVAVLPARYGALEILHSASAPVVVAALAVLTLLTLRALRERARHRALASDPGSPQQEGEPS